MADVSVNFAATPTFPRLVCFVNDIYDENMAGQDRAKNFQELLNKISMPDLLP